MILYGRVQLFFVLLCRLKVFAQFFILDGVLMLAPSDGEGRNGIPFGICADLHLIQLTGDVVKRRRFFLFVAFLHFVSAEANIGLQFFDGLEKNGLHFHFRNLRQSFEYLLGSREMAQSLLPFHLRLHAPDSFEHLRIPGSF